MGEVCGDDPTKGELNDMGYTCSELAKKSSKLEKRCGNSLVNETCPETCDGNCTCTDLAKKFSSRRRAKMCEKRYASARCPGTCEGWCTKKISNEIYEGSEMLNMKRLHCVIEF